MTTAPLLLGADTGSTTTVRLVSGLFGGGTEAGDS